MRGSFTSTPEVVPKLGNVATQIRVYISDDPFLWVLPRHGPYCASNRARALGVVPIVQQILEQPQSKHVVWIEHTQITIRGTLQGQE